MGKYQLDYASARPQMYDVTSRRIKAKRMVKLLQDHFGKPKLRTLSLLDVGASTGIIDNELAKHFGSVVGIDIDKGAIQHANQAFKRKNLSFILDDAMNMSQKDSSFDVVICAQVYEHVPSAKKLLKEIYRVLKPKGTCYFAALNRLWPWEPHYNLPFLSWLPKNIGNQYVRLTGKSDKYYETTKTYWGLKTLTKQFQVTNYTPLILRNPQKYGFTKLSKFPFNTIAWILSPLSFLLAPTFFWLLVKRKPS